MPGPATRPPGVNLFRTIWEILALFKAERGLLAFVLVVNLLGAAITGIGDPVSLKLMIDSISRKDQRFFLLLTGSMVLLYTLFRAVNYVSDLYSQKLRNRLSKRLMSRLLHTFYQLPYSRVSREDRGYFISRLYDEPAKLTEAVSVIVQLFASLAICFCSVVVCLVLSWKVAVFVSAIAPILVVLARSYGAKIRQTSLQESEAEARLREGLGRAVESYKNVKLFELHPQVFQRLEGLLQGSLQAAYLRSRHSALFKMLSGTFLSYAETAVMISAGFQVLQGHLTVGGLFGFVSAYWRVINSFYNLTVLIPSLTRLAAQLERIQELERVAEPLSCLPAARGGFGVVNLAFGYESGLLLREFSFHWQIGERILIVGPNGSGKSTLAHILSGFLETQQGVAKLPGIARTSALLSPFGFIPGSLEDNLAHANRSAEKRLNMQRLAGLFGLAGKLDRDPVSFSDGEKRKAQVLMTLLKEADLYLLDEPLANVDPRSKDVIMETIFSLTAGGGLVVILHGDEQYRRRFDRVIDLCPEEQLVAAST